MKGIVYTERHGKVEVIYINRPEKRNCINDVAAAALRDAFDRVERDDDVRVVILTGVGDRAFSTGLDLKQLAEEGPALIPRVIFEDTGWAGIGKRKFDKPLIAAVNGYAIAGGLELALSCDFVIAVEHAEFGANEATLGPIADAGACFRLPRWVPLPFARELLMTGRMVKAHEAMVRGLVNHVVAADKLLSFALEIAEQIQRNSPSSLAIMKRLMRETLGLHEDEAWPINDGYMVKSFDTPDFMEGPIAFVEKREAKFLAG